MNQNITKNIESNINEKNVKGILGLVFGKKITKDKRVLFVLPFVVTFIQRLLTKQTTKKK